MEEPATIKSTRSNAFVQLDLRDHDVKQISMIVYHSLVDTEGFVMTPLLDIPVNVHQVTRDFRVKQISTTAYQIPAIEESALTAIIVSLVNAILVTLEICAKPKSTNVNQILANMEAIVKI